MDKPKFPDPAPELNITVKAKLTADSDRYSSGSLLMTMHGGDINLNGEKVGSVHHAIPCGVSVVIGHRHYLVGYKDIFEAVYEAENRNSESVRE